VYSCGIRIILEKSFTQPTKDFSTKTGDKTRLVLDLNVISLMLPGFMGVVCYLGFSDDIYMDLSNDVNT
jgi:hypothetical protein